MNRFTNNPEMTQNILNLLVNNVKNANSLDQTKEEVIKALNLIIDDYEALVKAIIERDRNEVKMKVSDILDHK